jgi:CRISPR/Cas system-associated exonuclease Cas4 (RecB family)
MSVLPWSYSSWDAYHTCPRRYYELRVAKNFKEPESEHLIWGNIVHKAAEEYLRDGKPLPESTVRFKGQFDKFAALPGDKYVEVGLAVNRRFEPCDFWSSEAFVRGKGDYLSINGTKGAAVDWKTGKVKPSGQIRLMGFLVMLNHPRVEKLTNIFQWLKFPTTPTIEVITRDQLPLILEEFKPTLQDMLFSEKNNVWPEKPSGLCREYCPVKTCKYNGKPYRRGR